MLAIAGVPVLGAGAIMLVGVASSAASGQLAPSIGWSPIIVILAIGVVILAGFLTEFAHRLIDFASGSTSRRPRRNRRS